VRGGRGDVRVLVESEVRRRLVESEVRKRLVDVLVGRRRKESRLAGR
jgi:hypothetical protein